MGTTLRAFNFQVNGTLANVVVVIVASYPTFHEVSLLRQNVKLSSFGDTGLFIHPSISVRLVPFGAKGDWSLVLKMCLLNTWCVERERADLVFGLIRAALGICDNNHQM